ncbi:hypothetical protein [Corynebacterium ulceribovis]|uniref:hypothetical protein n=1 Tax=Corynebacterium ulceribovis TaxID=487732 RepID=UPI00037553D2|nr:hypothetical protein [Corynebacterium ulceribovis]
MTVIHGDVSDICGVRGDGVLRAAATTSRPGVRRAGLVTDSWRDIPIVKGKFTTPDLDPGPAKFIVMSGTTVEEFRLDVPESGPVEFHELIDASFEWSPPVVGRAQAAASEAAESARQAAESADRVGSAEAVLEARQAAEAAAEQVATDQGLVSADRRATEAAAELATQARDSAQAAAGAAASDAQAGVDAAFVTGQAKIDMSVLQAKDFAGDAANAAKEAKQTATDAEAHRGAAAEQAERAGVSAGAAAQSATAADVARQASDQALIDVRTLAERADVDAGRAEAARTDAERHATTAGSQAGAAAESARQAAASAEQAQTGAPEGGWTKAQLHINVQTQLDKVDSLPTSQTVQSMIADKATVTQLEEGLAGKMDKQLVSESVTSGSLVKRTSGGQVKVGAPAADDDAATRKYVDAQRAAIQSSMEGKADKSQLVSLEGRTPKIVVVSALPGEPDAETVYLVTG